MARLPFLLLGLLGGRGVLSLFSVHDDVLAFPQYEIFFPDEYYTVADVVAILENELPYTAKASTSYEGSPTSSDNAETDPPAAYQMVWFEDRKYLCKIPVVKPPPPMNATEKQLSKVKEEKELARAASRGWELLSELEGKCLYFVSGWWSYSFCHNREVRQFHHLPAQVNNQWPPTEDPDTQSYVLGRVAPEDYDKSDKGVGTELQTTGDLRYLVQKLGGGTTCDLTGKDRKIEVQFHCNSHGVDRIGWIKEVSICCYLMVIYTPRLCSDVAFLPQQENQANPVTCKAVLDDKQIVEFENEKAKAKEEEARRLLENGEKKDKKLPLSDKDGSQDKVEKKQTDGATKGLPVIELDLDPEEVAYVYLEL